MALIHQGHNGPLGPRPAGHTTNPLNDGVNGVVPLQQITGANIYITVAGGTTLYRIGTVGYSGFGPPGHDFGYGGPPTAGAQPPVGNMGSILPPTIAPTSSGMAGTPSYPAGTYMVGYTYVTSTGETTISPLTTVVMDGASLLFIEIPFPAIPSGFVTVSLTVPRLEDWHITRYAILVSSAVTVPTCSVYVDSVTQVNLLDTTALGAQNSANCDLYLRPGQIMFCQWTMVDPGAMVTFSVFGEKTS